MGLDWQYSPLLSEIDVGLAQQAASRGQENWCAPELMRLYAMQLPPQEQRLLTTHWTKRVSNRLTVGLCVLRIRWRQRRPSRENDAAMQLLQEALHDVDGSHRATDVKNALALCARIER
jgi:hypothetical protein